MVHGVVVDVVADGEHRVVEGGGPSPGEAHALVAGDVDDEGAGRELRQVLLRQEHQRRRGVLEHAVDDDVVPGEERGQRLRTVLSERNTAPRVEGVVGHVVVEVDDPCRVDR